METFEFAVVSYDHKISAGSSNVDTKHITDDYVRLLSLYMVVFALVLIAIMLALASVIQENDNTAASPVGWVAVVGAAIIFGSTGVPMKSPSLKELQVDSFVYSLYNR